MGECPAAHTLRDVYTAGDRNLGSHLRLPLSRGSCSLLGLHRRMPVSWSGEIRVTSARDHSHGVPRAASERGNVNPDPVEESLRDFWC